MIYSKTPLRISFFGGGTDLKSFYKKNSYGCSMSLAIDKYIYIIIKKQSDKFFEKYRLNYSKTEIVNNKDKIKNSIIRECLKHVNINDSLYISTISDVPAETGLGSSSAFCVGLLNALYKYKKVKITKEKLVEKATNIEIDILNKPIGKQDHYPACYGGFNFYKFYQNEKVSISKKIISKKNLSIILDNSQLFWTGVTRSADKILKKQNSNHKINLKYLSEIKKITHEVKQIIKNKDLNIDDFGKKMHESWMLKKNLANGITNKEIDKAYNIAIRNGAIGGKILGAGGGGFLLFISKSKYHKIIEKKLKKLNLIKIKFKTSPHGTIVKEI